MELLDCALIGVCAVIRLNMVLNPFIPEFLKWIPPSLDLKISILCKQRVKSMIINKMASIEDPDEMSHYKLSHLNLHCLYKCLYQSSGLKMLMKK